MPHSIAVELIAVQTPIVAAPGDQLMIYNGTCIGVYQPEGVNRRPPHSNTKYSEYTPDQILGILRAHGPSTGEQICNYLNIAVKDKQRRASVQRKVRFSMTNQGLIIRHPEDKRAKFPRYQIATKSTAKAA